MYVMICKFGKEETVLCSVSMQSSGFLYPCRCIMKFPISSEMANEYRLNNDAKLSIIGVRFHSCTGKLSSQLKPNEKSLDY